MKTRLLTCLLAVAAPLALAWCGESGAGDYYADGDSDRDDPGAGASECFSANDCQAGQYCNEFGRCVWPPGGGNEGSADGGVGGDAGTDEPWIPPEVEQEFGAPASGLRYVYVALPELDSVARIDSETLDVASLEVGDLPGQLATAPGQDLAVVLNEGSDSVSILRVSDGEDRIVTLPTSLRLNRVVVGPLGQTAVAYFELLSPDARDVGSFQDVAVIRLTDGSESVIGVSVGFRPRDVVFAPDESAAYVITEDGVSILDLGTMSEGLIAPTVALTASPLEEGQPVEVVIAPDGQRAYARWAGLDVVRSVDLVTGEIVDTPLGAVPTDIDVDGDGERLLAVLRETSELALMPLPGGIGEPSLIQRIDCSPLVVGLAVLDAENNRALLFTNALNQKAIAIVDIETGEVQTALLRKGVRALAISPDGATALVLHNKLPGDPSPADDFETQLDHRYGFSLLDLDTLFAKLQVTEADPGAFTFLPDGTGAYLVVADESLGRREIATLDLETFIVSMTEMGSHPIEIGSVPGTGRVYVSQEHPMGRISFIDVETGEVRTVTGFQLNSQITE